MAFITTWPWQQWAEKTPQALALIGEKQPFTWLELANQVNQLAAGFAQQGIIEQQVVALCGNNSEQMLFAYLALLQQGATVLVLNPQLPTELVNTLLSHLQVDAYCVLSLSTQFSSARQVYLRLAQPLFSFDWCDDRAATLTLTSGSTGLPRAIQHNFAAHLASAAGVLSLFPYTQHDQWLLSLPLFHVSGQSIVWRWLYRGARLALVGESGWLQAAQQSTHASCVPRQLTQLLLNPPKKLTHVLLGGSAIPAELVQQAEQAGIHCWCGYGMTEMASTIALKRADATQSVGNVLPHLQCRLVDGEIWLKGASLANGFWQDGKLHKITDDQGWLHTKDCAVYEKGELCLVGRRDNLFCSGGESIQPEEIEAVLLRHPAIQQAMVVPVDDTEFGQRPVAVIDTNADTLPNIAEWIKDKVANFQRPIHYYLLPETLKSAGIKISRQQVARWVALQGTHQEKSEEKVDADTE